MPGKVRPGPRELLRRHSREWRAATAHPFLDGVRNGTLPAKSLERWLQQDNHFVSDLLCFQARLLAVAPRAAQAVLAGGLVALEEELSWFEQMARRRGLPLNVPRHPTNEAYRALLDGLLTQPFAVGATALWGLELAYLEGWRGARPGATQYRDFVEHWTLPSFQDYVDRLEIHAEDSPEADAAWLATVALETAFWDMAFLSE